MGDVKRYDDYGCVSELGPWVEHTDYARLERERDEARECVKRLCGEISEAVKMLCMDRPISPANYLIVALEATPEHLR